MELNPEIDRLFDKDGKVRRKALAAFLGPKAKEKPDEAVIAFAVRNALRLLPLGADSSRLDDKVLCCPACMPYGWGSQGNAKRKVQAGSF